MNDQIQSLFKFLENSPCDFWAVNTIKTILNDNGFTEKKLTEKLNVKPGEKFYVTKNDSAIFAFTVGKQPMAETGFKIITAHSDSPCFRIKPHAEMLCDGGIVKLDTEVYGGPILYTWFDRPLSIAGRVIVKGEDALHPVTKLVKFNRPLLSMCAGPCYRSAIWPSTSTAPSTRATRSRSKKTCSPSCAR